MDLNQLLFRHQVALIHEADPARDSVAPSLASRYACEIAHMRKALGVQGWAGQCCS